MIRACHAWAFSHSSVEVSRHLSAATWSFGCAFWHARRSVASSKREHPIKSNNAAIIDRLLTILVLRCDNVIITETGQLPIGRDEAVRRTSAASYLAADVTTVASALATAGQHRCWARSHSRNLAPRIKYFYWQLYIMLSPPLIAVPGVQPMPLRAA